MIIAQRGFEANAKVITTSDQLLQDLVNLKQWLSRQRAGPQRAHRTRMARARLPSLTSTGPADKSHTAWEGHPRGPRMDR